ncbi:MAG: transposase [Chloroflexota bacterium]|nr:transposase [Chloroflexota bacterium]
MILQYAQLSRVPGVFQAMTGLTVAQFDALSADLLPHYTAAERQRLGRPDRQRDIGGGHQFTLTARDQMLLTVVWLRRYPTDAVLGYLFGVSETITLRTRHRFVPLLEAAGLDTMRLPDPGRKRRVHLDDLLRETPGLAVLVDTYEQRVQRHKDRGEADRWYSGKKKAHTVKTHAAQRAPGVDERDGRIVDMPPSVRGPTADLTVLKGSGLLPRLPSGVGVCGDLAYVGMDGMEPGVRGATPRRKPRGQPRPPEDVVYNTAFARRRVPVEHVIGRLRRYECLTQRDRHHRRGMTARNRAVAGLVNRANWRIGD